MAAATTPGIHRLHLARVSLDGRSNPPTIRGTRIDVFAWLIVTPALNDKRALEVRERRLAMLDQEDTAQAAELISAGATTRRALTCDQLTKTCHEQ